MMLLHRRAIACQEVVELVSDYLEGALSGGERRRFERHLAGCPHCSAYLEQMRATIAAAGVVAPEDLEPQALDDLVEIFRKFHEPDED